MRRNTIFCSTVHFIGTNLNLKWLSTWTDQRGMKRLVHVLFWHCDIIFETARNWFIFLMHNSKCRITIFDIIYKNTNGKQIINLIQGLILVHHLLIDTEKMLCSSRDIRLYASLINVSANLIHKSLNIFIPHALSKSNLLHQIIISLRIEIFHGKVFQLDLDLADTKTLCDRTVNILCFTCNTNLALFRLILEGTHIVKSVCQLNHNDTNILRHRKKHFTQILCLHFQTIRILVFCRLAMIP